MGVLVGVLVGVSVGVLVGVWVSVSVGVLVGVLVGVSVGVLVGVWVGVLVGVSVGVLVGVWVGVSVGVLVGVLVAVAVDVTVTTTVGHTPPGAGIRSPPCLIWPRRALWLTLIRTYGLVSLLVRWQSVVLTGWASAEAVAPPAAIRIATRTASEPSIFRLCSSVVISPDFLIFSDRFDLPGAISFLRRPRRDAARDADASSQRIGIPLEWC